MRSCLRAIRALNLADDPDYGARQPGLLGSLIDRLTGAEEANGPSAGENRALRVLRKHLTVKRADKVFVLDVVVSAYSGDKAANIADAIAEAYLADQTQSRSDSSIRAADALSAHLDELRRAVTTAADKVEKFKATHDLVGTDRQLISDQQLNDNGAQLNIARAKVGELQARADQLDQLRRGGADGGAMPEAIQSAVVTQLRASQADLLRRRSDMRTRYGDRYPDLIALDAQVRQTHDEIDAELLRLVRTAHADLDRAKKNERALFASQNQLKLQTISGDEASVTLQELARELETRRSIYQAFLSRAGETREQSSIDTTNARIISRAIPPVQPTWPLRALFLAGALVGGFGLGAALAFVAEFLAPTILSLPQLEAAAGAPVVGIIPAGPLSRPATATAATLALSRLCGPLHALRNKAKPYTVLVTSARGLARHRGDLAARIVSTAARNDVSVLLVAADPSRAAEGAETNGLFNVLNGECTVRSAVVADAATGVHRLGLGTPLTPGRESLFDERLDQFVKIAGRHFDIIAFDGGSFVDNLGAAPLATHVDDVLFVAQRGKTPQAEVVQTNSAVVASTGRAISAALLIDGLERA